MSNQELSLAVLKEVAALVDAAIVPVSNDHLEALSSEGKILNLLIDMRAEGVIRGDVVTIGAGSVPHRMTNIRLTYQGLRVLFQQPKEL